VERLPDPLDHVRVPLNGRRCGQLPDLSGDAVAVDDPFLALGEVRELEQ
jgi:hypothetical protein